MARWLVKLIRGFAVLVYLTASKALP